MKQIRFDPGLTRLDAIQLPRWAWLVLTIVAWGSLVGWLDHYYHHARNEFMTRPWTPLDEMRPQGSGHAEIDFGGQYVLARMILKGEGARLYHRDRLRDVVRESFPPELESRAQRAGEAKTDEENMMFWFVGNDADPEPAIGGPLYPPTHACLYAPLALWPAPQAYHLFQVVSLAAVLGTGLLVATQIRARFWLAWPVATILILSFPHHQCGLDLAQNQAMTLFILTLGIVARGRGYHLLAGVAWSALAFKPTWAVAFLLVPIFLKDWRMLAGMVIGGASWVMLTLPVVGFQSWFDWLEVGQMAAAEYEVNANWTNLSRDLGGLFRRLLVDFHTTPVIPSPIAALLGITAVFIIIITTAWLSFWRASHEPALIGFVLLSAYLACFRFVYYDAVIAVLPVMLLSISIIQQPARRVTIDAWSGVLSSATLTLFGFLLIWEIVIKHRVLALSLTFGRLAPPGPPTAGMPANAPSLSFDTTVFTPSDTVILLLLWAWWAIKLAWRPHTQSSNLTR